MPTYDVKANLTSAGSPSFSYDSANRLIAASGGVQLGYDALGRMAWTTGSPNFTHFVYQGDQIAAEYDYNKVLQRRYVYGPNLDEPIVWYEGADFSNKRFLVADERGSITAVTDTTGNPYEINSYDEYGIPNVTAAGTGNVNLGRFQYTGQAWLPELGLYSYKARMYSPSLGRFLQTDPIGPAGGINLYGYVGNNPINRTDPRGLAVRFIGRDCQLVDTGYDIVGPDGEVTESVITSAYICFETNDAFVERFNSELAGGSGGGDASNTPAPQKEEPKRSFANCGIDALKHNAATLGLDTAGALASLVPAGKGLFTVGAAVVGTSAGTATLGIGAAHGDATTIAEGVTGHYVSAAGGILDTTKGLAGYLPGVGQVLAFGTLAYDAYTALDKEGCF